eukprot:g5544.t1
MFKASPFRHVTVKNKKDETYLMKLVSETSETTHGMAASAKWLAVPYGSPGSLAVLPVDFSEHKRSDNPPLVVAHAIVLSDVKFNPFDDSSLATAAGDGSVKVWQLPAAGLSENMSTPAAEFSGLGPVSEISWHPSAAGVIAVAAKEQVCVLDVASKSIKYTVEVKEAVGIAWSENGSRLAFITKDCDVCLWDPRQGSAPSVKSIKDKARKVQHVLWLGPNMDKLLVAFSNNQHKPGFAVYDPTSWECKKTAMLAASNGMSLPVYDSDSNLLFTSIRGSASLQILEVTEKKATFDLNMILDVRLDETAKSFCLTSKRGMNVLDCEVQRVYSLHAHSIRTYTAVVPKKGRGFYADIHPPTASTTHAQTAEEYFAGGNASPLKVSCEEVYNKRLAEKDAATGGQITAEREEEKEALVNKLKAKADAERQRLEGPQVTIEEVKYAKSVTRKVIDSKFKGSIFKHISCKEPREKAQYWYDLTADKHVPLNRNIRCNDAFFAFPWKTNGGSAVCVWPVDKPGRFPPSDKLGLLRGHKEQVFCFDLNPFDHTQFASASGEGSALLFRFPADGPTGNEQPTAKLQLSGKATYCAFSPYVKNMLLTSSSDFDHCYIRFWNTGEDGKLAEEPVFKLELPVADTVMDIATEPTGTLLAYTTTDNKVKLWNLKEKKEVAVATSALNGRATYVMFCPGTDKLLLIGQKGGGRGCEVYKQNDLTLLKDFLIDNNTGIPLPHYDTDSNVLLVGTTGGTSIRTYEVSKDAPYVTHLGGWSSTNQMRGLCFLPKTQCDVREIEILKGFRLSTDAVYPMSWTVPRKRKEFFQDDLFQDTMKLPVQTIEEFAQAQPAEPLFFSLKPHDMVNLSEAPEEELTERQKKYRQGLIDQMEKPKATNADGQATKEEVESHFRNLAEKGYVGKSRFDARQDEVNEVDEDEWGNDD